MELVLDAVEHQRQADTLRPEYPLGVPSKFGVDGKAQHFPGNTIISYLSPLSDLYASMLGVLIGCLGPAYTSTSGPRSENRTMVSVTVNILKNIYLPLLRFHSHYFFIA